MKTATIFRNIGCGMAAIAFLAAGFSNAGEKVSPKIKPEKVPPEVQKIIDETLSGQHGLRNFDANKGGWGFDSSVKLSDLKTGEPFKVFKIPCDSLEKYDENVPISVIAKRIDRWGVPLLLNGKCFSTFEIWKTRKNPQWDEGVITTSRDTIWQRVREAWPDSEGYHPVVVYFGFSISFHIPEINDENLTPLYRYTHDSLHNAIDTSYKVLLDSKIALKYEKTHLPPKPRGGTK